MDVNEYLAYALNKHMPDGIQDTLILVVAERMFLEGYNLGAREFTWRHMEDAPKDGTHILLAQEWGDVGIGYWHKMGPYDCDTEEWCVQDSFNSESESLSVFIDPVAWMPLPKYTHKP